MRRNLLLALGLVICAGPVAVARDPKDSLATPVFDDMCNNVAMYSATIGSGTSQAIYAPNQNRDTRRVLIANPSTRNVMHISTWAINAYDIPVNSTDTQTTWAVPVSTAVGSMLDLNSKATYYALFEAGSASAVVRALELWNDPSRPRR